MVAAIVYVIDNVKRSSDYPIARYYVTYTHHTVCDRHAKLINSVHLFLFKPNYNLEYELLMLILLIIFKITI